MVSLLIYVLVLLVVVSLLWYVVTVLPLPAPFDKVARVVVVVIAALALIFLLLGAAGEPVALRWPR